jgi:cytosine/creatinine deaminase
MIEIISRLRFGPLRSVGTRHGRPGWPTWLAEHGVKVTVLEDAVCIALMRDFIVSRPELWHEDIGE